MSAGRRRTDTPYIWPSNILRPEGTRLIYLGLLHWVALAKAATGHPDGAGHVRRRHKDFTEGLADRGLEVEDVFADPESSRRFVDSMPSADVSISLLAAAHRDPNTRWTANRRFDLDALSVAVPYRDLVATDREAAHAVVAEGLSDRWRPW